MSFDPNDAFDIPRKAFDAFRKGYAQKGAGFKGNQIHISQVLTNFAMACIPEEDEYMVPYKAFPEVTVTKQTGEYPVWERRGFTQDAMDPRAPCSLFKTCSLEVGLEDYKVREFGKAFEIPWQFLENQLDALDIEEAAVTALRLSGLIRRNIDFRDNFFRPGVWNNELQGVTGVPGQPLCVNDPDAEVPFFDDPNCDPIANIRRCMKKIGKTGKRVTDIFIGCEAAEALMNNPMVIARLRDDALKSLDNDSLVRLLSNNLGDKQKRVRVHVLEAVASADKDSDSCYIYGPHVLMLHRPERASLLTASAGMQFKWAGFQNQYRASGRIQGTTDIVVSAPIWDWRRHCHVIQSLTAFDQRITSQDLGCFLANVVSDGGSMSLPTP